jgi:hypothetical protein
MTSPGQLCAIVDWALLSREQFFHATYISYQQVFDAVALAYFAIPMWCLAMTLIKISIVLTLLRLPLKKPWKIGLYALLAVQVTYWLANTVYLFAKCQPHHAAWDFSVPVRHCPSDKTDIMVSSIGSAINITTDFLLSVAPMFLFWNLRRPLRERVLICSLTGIGLFASAASIVKAVVVAEWTSAPDRWPTAISIATWTITEQFVSVLAACSPSLKTPIEKMLNRLGFPLVEHDPNISFVHMPSRMHERELRQRARAWMGDEETQINAVVADSTAATQEKRRDIESLGEKSVSTSTSTSASASATASSSDQKDA